MAPLSLLARGAPRLFAPSLGAWSCSNAVTRYACVLHSAIVTQVKCLSSPASGPPKVPLTGYMRYFVQQQPIVARYNPEVKVMDITKKIAKQWKTMSSEQKRPFEEASIRARQQYKMDVQRYQAQLTPEQLEQQSLEKREKLAKRRAIRKKRELNILGKPKRPRTSRNIFFSEQFDEARGNSAVEKMKSLSEDWKKLLNHQKQIYTQLAEDDKIRYKNEIKSWEDHMVEIGREDLIREKTLSAREKAAKAKTRTRTVKKAAASKAKPGKATKAKPGKATKTSSATTVKTTKKR